MNKSDHEGALPIDQREIDEQALVRANFNFGVIVMEFAKAVSCLDNAISATQYRDTEVSGILDTRTSELVEQLDRRRSRG
jgi:hypothetical protein